MLINYNAPSLRPLAGPMTEMDFRSEAGSLGFGVGASFWVV